MAEIRRILADGRLPGTGVYTDAIAVDLGVCWHVIFSGIAAVDPTTRTVTGYEPHNGTFLPDALERQVAHIFSQVERLMESASNELSTGVTFEHLTKAMVFLREDFPRAVSRFNDAYTSEFARRGIGVYPTRTTVLKTTLPEPNALVEIQFEAVVGK